MDNYSNVDGCCIFYKTSRFKLIDLFLFEFQSITLRKHSQFTSASSSNVAKGMDRMMSKDNIAVAALMEMNIPGKPPQKIMVVNVHIHWDPSLCDVKLVQTQLLLEEIVETLARLKQPKLPMLVCGDFNSTPDSAVYKLLNEGEVPGDHSELFPDKYDYGTYSQNGLSHGIRLKSAYGSLLKEPDFTNYTGDYVGCLDYIWYTHESIAVSRVLSEIDKQKSFLSALPAPHFPSDHIPIAAEFCIRPK